MGTVIRSYLVLGVAVDPRAFDRDVKAFEHDHPETMRFDPQTGRELWTTECGLIDAPDSSLEAISTGNDDDTHYLGIVLAKTKYGEVAGSAALSPESLAAETERVRARLMQFGIESPDIRLWTVISLS